MLGASMQYMRGQLFCNVWTREKEVWHTCEEKHEQQCLLVCVCVCKRESLFNRAVQNCISLPYNTCQLTVFVCLKKSKDLFLGMSCDSFSVDKGERWIFGLFKCFVCVRLGLPHLKLHKLRRNNARMNVAMRKAVRFLHSILILRIIFWGLFKIDRLNIAFKLTKLKLIIKKGGGGWGENVNVCFDFSAGFRWFNEKLDTDVFKKIIIHLKITFLYVLLLSTRLTLNITRTYEHHYIWLALASVSLYFHRNVLPEISVPFCL